MNRISMWVAGVYLAAALAFLDLVSAWTVNRGWLTLPVVLGLFGLGVTLFIGIVVVGVLDRWQPEARSASVIPDPSARSTNVRPALALSLVLIVACTSQAGQPSATASPIQVRLASGGVVEYPIPIPAPFLAGGLGGLVAGPDGNLWFVESIANLQVGSSREVFGRMTPSGVVTEFDVPGELSLLGMTAGPDGNIWTTANGGSQGGPDWILRISLGGEVTKFQAGAIMADGFGTSPEGITAGPDGNIWFTEVRTGRIGRMTPTGALTEFQIPALSSGGIAAGPDGNLWYVESGAIARITPAGAVTEYPLSHGPADLRPHSIVAGSDGNIWFTETGNQLPQANVGRITPKGTVTRFALPPGSQPVGMARGPDGNVWFTNWSGNTVGRISPRGTIREFPLPRLRAGPSGIAAGPDGRIWFAETGVSRIASIGLTVPEVTGAKVVSFGTKSVSSDRSVSITNTGDGALSIASAAIVGPDRAAFAKTHDTCTGSTLAVNGTCEVDVTFTPGSSAGFEAAQLAFTDNATASPQTVSLIAQLPTCSLPVFQSWTSLPGTYQVPPAPGSVWHGGFLSLADGVLVVDPTGGFTNDGSRSTSLAAPVLYGLPYAGSPAAAMYDRPARRWVPSPVAAISPDGTRYAYVDNSQNPTYMHVVDVATGSDRKLELSTIFAGVLAFAAEGIYYDGSFPGLRLIDPDAGTRRQIFGDGNVRAVGAGAAWIGTINPQDPNPPRAEGDSAVSDELLKRDLSTGETTAWFYRAGASVGIGPVSGGRVLVTTYEGQGGVSWLVSGPNQAERLTVAGSEDSFSYTGGMIADTQGFWLGGEGGIYLWTARTGAVLVSDVSARPAGACA